MTKLAENGFSVVDPELISDIKDYANGPWSTLIVENMFKDIGDFVRHVKSGEVGGPAIWHRQIRGQELPAHGLPPLEASTTARTNAAPDVPKNVFSPETTNDKCSIGADPYSTVSDPSRT